MHSFHELEDAISDGTIFPYTKAKRKKNRARPPSLSLTSTYSATTSPSSATTSTSSATTSPSTRETSVSVPPRRRRFSLIEALESFRLDAQDEDEEEEEEEKQKSNGLIKDEQKNNPSSTKESEERSLVEEDNEKKAVSHSCPASLPLMVVGAGLTAADAITIARLVGVLVLGSVYVT